MSKSPSFLVIGGGLLLLPLCFFAACGKKDPQASPGTSPGGNSGVLGGLMNAGSKSGKTLSPEEQKAVEEQTKDFEQEAAHLEKEGTWETERMAFYEKWAALNPSEAIRHGREHNKAGADTAVVARILTTWCKNDHVSALEWVASQPASAERGVWFSMVVEGWPLENLKELQKNLGEWLGAPGGMLAARTFSKRLVKENPEEVYSWIESGLAESPLRSELTKQLTKDWAEEDPGAAGDYLNKADAAAVWRDDAIEGLALAMVDQEKEAAMKWLESIPDPEKREKAIQRLNAPR